MKLKRFREVWRLLDTDPEAECPDGSFPEVSLGRVLCTMASVASKYRPGDPADDWVLAYVSIVGETLTSELVQFWAGETAVVEAAIERLVSEVKLRRTAGILTLGPAAPWWDGSTVRAQSQAAGSSGMARLSFCKRPSRIPRPTRMAWTVRIKQRESGAWAAVRYYDSRAEALECARHGLTGRPGTEPISGYEWAVFEGPRKVVDWLTDDPRDDPPEPPARTRWERLGDDPLSEDA